MGVAIGVRLGGEITGGTTRKRTSPSWMQVTISCIYIGATRGGACVTGMNVARIRAIVARIHIMLDVIGPMVAWIRVFVTHPPPPTVSVATPPASQADCRTRVASSPRHLFHSPDKRTIHAYC